ncbi:hypothetical protein M8J77_025516 [Diaphorina citri]|nr:hypothetical protein M8J77_025516 [Diaphorina citri]
MLVPRTFSCYFVSSILVISNLSFGRVECYGAIRALKVKFWDVLGYKMNPEQIFRSADAVCFDVDSTLFTTEAIDELADYLNKQDDVKNVTKQAMSGQVGLRPALLARLDIMKPSLSTMRRFIEERPAMLSPGVEDLIQCLHKNNVHVYLISGGFRSVIMPKAKELGIPPENIFANRLMFYFDGTYAGLDLNEPTSDNFGKAKVIESLKAKFGYKTVVMVGDGITDMEAAPPADICIGYGGNVVRPQVKSTADWFVMDFKELSQGYKKC